MTESAEKESETTTEKSSGGSFISPTFLLILLLFVLLGWGGMALYGSLFERVVGIEHGETAALVTLESKVGSVAGRVAEQQKVNDAQARYLSLRVGADLYSSLALMEYLAADPGTPPAARQRAARIAAELDQLRGELSPVNLLDEKPEPASEVSGQESQPEAAVILQEPEVLTEVVTPETAPAAEPMVGESQPEEGAAAIANPVEETAQEPVSVPQDSPAVVDPAPSAPAE